MSTKIIIFYDAAFPYDGTRPDIDQLKALPNVSVVDAHNLKTALSAENVSCFIHLHGRYFPKEAWAAIIYYLRQGNGWISIGAAPFRVPVYQEDGRWMEEEEQTAYHQQLNIHEALTVKSAPIHRLAGADEYPLLQGKEQLFDIQSTYGLILHFTKTRDIPHENGSGGPMDAHIYPLLKGISKRGREVAAPVVLVENTKGQFAGGRWILVNQQLTDRFWKKDGFQLLISLAAYCAEGVTEIWIKPGYACYYPGETPTVSVQLQSLALIKNAACSAVGKTWEISFNVLDKSSKPVCDTRTLTLPASRELLVERMTLSFSIQPGYYAVNGTARSSAGEVRRFRQGFWGYSEQLLQAGAPLKANRDYFEKDGRPYPIVGMTYMTSDVSRKYLWLPNVSVWDKDMAQMKKAGINHIRTGVWTGYRQLMFIDGHPYEEVLRAVDAFVLTAKKYDIDLCFDFFAFTPEAWEGTNPYLDPRSIEAQKRFIAAIVSRHKQTTNIHWDLINEPSLFDPDRIFSGPQPLKDTYEKQAFISWVKAKYSSLRAVQEKWNMTPEELPDFDAMEIPEQEDISFDVQNMRRPTKNIRWLDYTLFTMEMHNQWAGQLADTIKSMTGNHLVTVGQDEALRSQRPTPFFYESVVDYTTNHTWWMMDQLVWDGVFTKTANKPNLVQETGIMYVENPDGTAKRTEEELRNILERKYAYAFSTGAAGAVQWLWNTNFYMNNVNESNIGALRADGTEKPEADVSYDFGRFIGETRDLFVNRRLEETAVIFPYANDFSNRKLAFEATTRLTRIFSYDLNIHLRAFGEYHLGALLNHPQPPKLVIVPSAHHFSRQAAEKLTSYMNGGGAVLFTGPIRLDEYWKYDGARFANVIGTTKIRNVRREEALLLNGKLLSIGFGDRKIAEVSKEVLLGDQGSELGVNELREFKVGKGKLLWCPLPVELNERQEPLRELYSHALAWAGVKQEFHWLQGGDLPGVYGKKLAFDNGNLFIFVSEYGTNADIQISDADTEKVYSFMLEKERSVLFATDSGGNITTVYRPDDVVIQTK
ncbi:Beta-galactosidase [Evansella caseinilytica]|uniref:Beta-galactosidase n=1 Tax=Evansella caseinilytica TaxID=1503961 RepID=A0A1H3RG63_9BACI|nr:cellulase family glycosylhydrolase [Evansella caseinilytica]SDZ24563.1 Beta-galactosidase [Evansella caseinilytica]